MGCGFPNWIMVVTMKTILLLLLLITLTACETLSTTFDVLGILIHEEPLINEQFCHSEGGQYSNIDGVEICVKTNEIELSNE